ncbi:Putative heterokaryon incompatibility [Septoria linicola]|uniref:Heterokaryon incompatibility n=1 Tax=Septoria linicola TaxID=215465 RepID=A0A9Q9EGW6_9PEZI|nr:putative heterokaryon incompatibility [Septoria linicola]USW51196.1 Putative heterokaryon incompatibility [Septoria linicola]
MSFKRQASAHSLAPSKRYQQNLPRRHEESDQPCFRLFNIDTGELESWPLNDHPPYLAASHTWSERVFTSEGLFADQSFGWQGLTTVMRTRCTSIRHCWIDTICIEQTETADKLEQIPLMGQIFGKATCVVVFVNAYLNASQADVDLLAAKLDGALAMCLDEAWTQEGASWQHGEGREWLLLGMKGLLRLANTAWMQRIWTLQEYVLAKEILWIGRDLVPISVDNYAISALPDICNTLHISECLQEDFSVLSTHFAAMANARAGSIDRTRIMELPGNRKATVPVDEVYGVMAASGVIIEARAGETKEGAWNRWCHQAVRDQHIRWVLLPVAANTVSDWISCVFPPFSMRHKLSAASGLDSVCPLGPPSVENGAVIVTARVVGMLHIVRRLGRVHEPTTGVIHRDITVILFASGTWRLAMSVVWAFGGGRYNIFQSRLIAQVLVQSYASALSHVAATSEARFAPVMTSNTQRHVWNDFMAMQQSQMIGLNDCVGYLSVVTLDHSFSMPLVVNLAEHPPDSPLMLMDMNAKGPDQRTQLMVAQRGPQGSALDMPSFHKVGMTLPVSEELSNLWRLAPVIQIRLGGDDCFGCARAQDSPTPELRNMSEQPACSRILLRQLARHQNWVMHKLHYAKRCGLRAPVASSRVARRRLNYSLGILHHRLQDMAGKLWPRAFATRGARTC